MSSLNKQEGGDHYKKLKIQPVEYIHANNIPFIEGCIIKYATRWKDKNGIEDLKKIIHFAELLIELEQKNINQNYVSVRCLSCKNTFLGLDTLDPCPYCDSRFLEVV